MKPLQISIAEASFLLLSFMIIEIPTPFPSESPKPYILRSQH